MTDIKAMKSDMKRAMNKLVWKNYTQTARVRLKILFKVACFPFNRLCIIFFCQRKRHRCSIHLVFADINKQYSIVNILFAILRAF